MKEIRDSDQTIHGMRLGALEVSDVAGWDHKARGGQLILSIEILHLLIYWVKYDNYQR